MRRNLIGLRFMFHTISKDSFDALESSLKQRQGLILLGWSVHGSCGFRMVLLEKETFEGCEHIEMIIGGLEWVANLSF